MTTQTLVRDCIGMCRARIEAIEASPCFRMGFDTVSAQTFTDALESLRSRSYSRAQPCSVTKTTTMPNTTTAAADEVDKTSEDTPDRPQDLAKSGARKTRDTTYNDRRDMSEPFDEDAAFSDAIDKENAVEHSIFANAWTDIPNLLLDLMRAQACCRIERVLSGESEIGESVSETQKSGQRGEDACPSSLRLALAHEEAEIQACLEKLKNLRARFVASRDTWSDKRDAVTFVRFQALLCWERERLASASPSSADPLINCSSVDSHAALHPLACMRADAIETGGTVSPFFAVIGRRYDAKSLENEGSQPRWPTTACKILCSTVHGSTALGADRASLMKLCASLVEGQLWCAFCVLPTTVSQSAELFHAADETVFDAYNGRFFNGSFMCAACVRLEAGRRTTRQVILKAMESEPIWMPGSLSTDPPTPKEGLRFGCKDSLGAPPSELSMLLLHKPEGAWMHKPVWVHVARAKRLLLEKNPHFHVTLPYLL